MKIGLIPLDERPVNTRYPSMIAAIAGAQVEMPPASLLSSGRAPADCAALINWLQHVAPDLDGLIVSCEMLGYGSLISSRISSEPAGAILARLDALRAIRRQHPQLTMYGFNLITRVSNADDATEEAAYWAEHGTQLYTFSQLLDQRQQGQQVAAEMARFEAEIPQAFRNDFLARRLRNHTVSLGVLQLLVDDVFDVLVLSSDDTSPFGMPSREKRWLAQWAGMLALDERLLMYPGADEVGCALLARLLNQRAGSMPSVAASYAPPEANTHVAAFEDGPIHVTVERQVRAIGGRFVEHNADIWVAVNAPVARRSEWHPVFAAREREERLPALQKLVAQIAKYQSAGTSVVVADVAYPNGADPALIELLQANVDLTWLAAYGAWNTAGNTIGTALAQASAAQFAQTEAQREAQQRFLLHRFLEDWGYQHLARAELRDWLQARYGMAELSAATMESARAYVQQRLETLLEQLAGFAAQYQIAPGSVRFPWNRTFEIDFDLVSKHNSV